VCDVRFSRIPMVVTCTLLLCVSASARTEQYRTYVAPTSAETMQRPCEYELTLRDASKPVKAVFVVIERGWQVGNLYFDPDVTGFAERHDIALMLARHCRAKTKEDMDIIPEHGIGRALLQSLNQFAQLTHHPELAESKLILFSFSGGGSMVARMVAYTPERILAAIGYAPGHREPIGIDTVELPEASLSVPQFIIANGADDRCGTQRPYAYFEKYRQRAPLTFMVQNRVPHCCVTNVIHTVLAWLEDVVDQRLSTNSKILKAIDPSGAWRGFIKPEDSGVRSFQTEPVWNVTDAWIVPGNSPAPAGAQDAGWLPSKRFAKYWLAFQKTRKHPIMPLE
jgi:predicted esterase